MPFGGKFDTRFKTIYEPAICAVELISHSKTNPIRKQKLKAYRVDNNKTGDSILTEIMDGVAHSTIILADISEYGRWADEEGNLRTTPNGNVMYEVGLALSCRNQTEVLLIKDIKDKGRVLFDVSTIPHLLIDFSEPENSKAQLSMAIRDRINERDLTKSIRLQIALSSLSQSEIRIIRANKKNSLIGWEEGKVSFTINNGLPRLLEKGILRYYGIHNEKQIPLYVWTDFGKIVCNLLPEIPEDKTQIETV